MRTHTTNDGPKTTTAGSKDEYTCECPLQSPDAVRSKSFVPPAFSPKQQTLDKLRVAVLPLQNISPDPKDEYFADGLTEELISTMSKISGLKVIARTSVMRYKGAGKSISEIASELGVGSVLEGSVRKAGEKLRITVQLINSETSDHIWSESYDRELKDVFAIQSDISKTVAEALRIQLLSKEERIIEKRHTVNPEAYALYLKGRFYWNERTQQSVNKAVKCFEQAAKIDSTFALAYSGLADCYNALASFDWMTPDRAYPLAKSFSLKALDIDESLAEAHASLAVTLKNQTWDFGSAERELRRAIELRPSYAPAYHWLASLVGLLGRVEEALSWEKRGVEIDPYSLVINTGLAYWLAVFGKADQAIQQLTRTIELDSEYIPARVWKSELHLLLSEYDAAIEQAAKAVDIEKTPPTELNLAYAYACAGRRDEAQNILDNVRSRAAREHVCPVGIAGVEFAMGRTEEGFKLLEKALDEKDDCLLDAATDPWFKQYRSDPRWKQIHAKMGIEKS